MADSLTSVDDLIQYAYRELGSPVINIEIDETQAADRVDDCLQMFCQRHFSGTNEVYLRHVTTATEETKGYVTLPSDIVAVTGIYEGDSSENSAEAFERINFRLANSDIFDHFPTSDGSLSNYYLTRQYITDLRSIMTPKRTFNFNPVTHIFNPVAPLKEGYVFILRAYQSVDAEEYEDVYNNEWVKSYSTALIKKQWGNNLKKFDGVQLPGGITLNGQQIYDEAVEEIRILKDEFSEKYELPIDFFIA